MLFPFYYTVEMPQLTCWRKFTMITRKAPELRPYAFKTTWSIRYFSLIIVFPLRLSLVGNDYISGICSHL